MQSAGPRPAWPRFLYAVAAAWAALLPLLYLGGLAARWSGLLVGPSWTPTLALTLNCFELALAGYLAGRLHRAAPLATAAVFAATLAFCDFGDAMPMHVAWLFRLTRDLLSDSRFLDSWISTVGAHALLFGSLFAGAALSRAPEKPVSLAVREGN